MDGVTRFMQGPWVELQADDGKDEDGKHNKQPDLHQRGQSLENGLQDNL